MKKTSVAAVTLLMTPFLVGATTEIHKKQDKKQIKQKTEITQVFSQKVFSFDDSINDSLHGESELDHDLIKTEVYVDSEFIKFKFHFLKPFKEVIEKDGIIWSTTTVNVYVDSDNNVSPRF
ncbi:MAG: hypothetical protein ACE5GF_06965 [Thermodesulfobacteriota bacterium]